MVGGFIRKHSKKVWDKISQTVWSVAAALYRVIKVSLETLWEAVVLASVKIFKKTVGAVDLVYFYHLSFLLRVSKSLGVLGELIFTLFGLVWLLWPLYATYMLSKIDSSPQLWLGGVIFTVILIVRGRSIILKNK